MSGRKKPTNDPTNRMSKGTASNLTMPVGLLMNYCELYLPISLLLVEILVWKGLFLSKTSQPGSNAH